MQMPGADKHCPPDALEHTASIRYWRHSRQLCYWEGLVHMNLESLPTLGFLATPHGFGASLSFEELWCNYTASLLLLFPFFLVTIIRQLSNLASLTLEFKVQTCTLLPFFFYCFCQDAFWGRNNFVHDQQPLSSYLRFFLPPNLASFSFFKVFQKCIYIFKLYSNPQKLNNVCIILFNFHVLRRSSLKFYQLPPVMALAGAIDKWV